METHFWSFLMCFVIFADFGPKIGKIGVVGCCLVAGGLTILPSINSTLMAVGRVGILPRRIRSCAEGAPTRRALLRGGRSYAEGAPTRRGAGSRVGILPRRIRSYAEGAPTRRALLRGGRSYAEGAPTRRHSQHTRLGGRDNTFTIHSQYIHNIVNFFFMHAF